MTRSVADVLGIYLLAKEAGVYLDAAGTEICPLPIVPLFETIDDLRAAPAIMRELLSVPLVRRSTTERSRTVERAKSAVATTGHDRADQQRNHRETRRHAPAANAVRPMTALDVWLTAARTHGPCLRQRHSQSSAARR